MSGMLKRSTTTQGQGAKSHISECNEAFVKEEQHAQKEEEEAKTSKANANLCIDTVNF